MPLPTPFAPPAPLTSTSATRIRLAGSADTLVSGWRQLVLDRSPAFRRDAALVCGADGVVVRWSAAALCHWSSVVRQFVADHPWSAAGAQLTLLLPDVGSDVLKKVLVWSVDGRVVLNRRELTEATKLLFNLGVAVPLVHETIKKDRDDGRHDVAVKTNSVKVSKPATAVKRHENQMDVGASRSRRTQREVEELDVDAYCKRKIVKSKPKKKVKKVSAPPSFGAQCPVCEFEGRTVYNVKEHMSTTHFKGSLRRLWRDMGGAAVCFVCAKEFDREAVAKSDSGFLRHIGAVHDLVMDVIPVHLEAQLTDGDHNYVRRANSGKGKKWNAHSLG